MNKLIIAIVMSSFIYAQCLGDVNDDYIINIQDIMIVIGFILNANELNHLDLWLSDFDSNQIINVQDIILIIDKILRN